MTDDILDFPDPRLAGEEGLLGFGGNLHWRNLLEAYRRGIFPWPIEGLPLPWFSPAQRGVLFFHELRVPRSLAKARRRNRFRFTIDTAFERVIRQCAVTPRGGEEGTWITGQMIEAYIEFHRRGFAHSVEAWEGEELVGGLYGVDPGGVFAGESMFFLRPSASKLTLLHLIDHLASRGSGWIDIQVLTPHMESLGAREIPRDEFLRLLETALAEGAELWK